MKNECYDVLQNKFDKGNTSHSEDVEHNNNGEKMIATKMN